ncbi:aminotransferase, class-I, pyridoxal-phosphate-binding [Septoria linicola]|nr:aminotransferase, class-I, pyridoxal-phosphate-binding [Septoria linicola]
MLSNGLSLIPPDPIFETTKLFNADSNPKKVNLGQGTYKDDHGQPSVFPAVKEAKQRLIDGNHEYLPILGLPAFRQEAKKLIFGEKAEAVIDGRVATCQALSGTGSLHLAGAFLRRVTKNTSTVYVTDPSWSNHRAVFESVGFPVTAYRYLDSAGRFDYENLLRTLDAATTGSIFVLHASAHNPSGRDPTCEQWQGICKIMHQRKLFALFDAAYLGLTTGDFENDVWPICYFASQGLELGVCLSFAKMMGLYGERVGALSFLTESQSEVAIVESHLEQLMRAEISNPPAFGARVATEVLQDTELNASWREQLGRMSARLQSMRQRLVDELNGFGCKVDFSHVVEQVGMFSILGLDLQQVTRLREEYSIYMADSPSQLSRISIAGLNDGNVAYVAHSIHAVCQ